MIRLMDKIIDKFQEQILMLPNMVILKFVA
jgi:hypothetical protein